MVKLTTIYWRDIPAQVVGKAERETRREALSHRFTVAIDRAAMRAGRGSANAYLNDWRREISEVEGDLAAVVRMTASRLEQNFSDALLERFVKAGGRAPGE